jgi:hypothetical protein
MEARYENRPSIQTGRERSPVRASAMDIFSNSCGSACDTGRQNFGEPWKVPAHYDTNGDIVSSFESGRPMARASARIAAGRGARRTNILVADAACEYGPSHFLGRNFKRNPGGEKRKLKLKAIK